MPCALDVSAAELHLLFMLNGKKYPARAGGRKIELVRPFLQMMKMSVIATCLEKRNCVQCVKCEAQAF